MSSGGYDEVEEARRAIQATLDRVAALAQGEAAHAEFFSGLLGLVLEAMQAPAGLVWLAGDGGRVEPVCHAGLEATGITASPEAEEAHLGLVRSCYASPGGLVVPPRAQLTGPDGQPVAANPTDLLVVSAPIGGGPQHAGLIEVFHQPNADDVQRGYLRFLEQVAVIAAGYLARQRERGQLVVLDQQRAALEQAEQFSRRLHESLDPVATAFVLANEARRMVGCDRVGVLVQRRGRLRLEAVSGQESVERRASAVQAIEGLARVVARAGEPLWHPNPSRELPPQIEEELEHYIDESHAAALAIIPLEKPRPTPVVKPGGVDAVAVAKAEAAPAAPELVGVLVAEWFAAAGQAGDAGTRARVDLVAEHGRVALSNALVHTGLPLYPLLNLAGKSRVLTTARNLPRTLLAALGLVGLVAALVFVPAELRLEGKGTLEPVNRRDVFAGIDGVVHTLEPALDHGAEVKQGQLLATLRNTELDVAIADVLGRKESSVEQLNAARRSLLEPGISADEKIRLAGRRAQFEREIESLEAQQKLYEAKRKDLDVRSPIDGVIVTWQVRDRLLLRPVEKGQVLMSVADKTGPWELELKMPDDRLGHVNRAWQEARDGKRDLEVDYILATDPGTRHRGVVEEIHEQAEVHGEEGNAALVKVQIDPGRHEREELGAGATVTARIACGRRSLGYVWFHDVLSFIQTQILFRLW
jgi:hypothetical protein